MIFKKMELVEGETIVFKTKFSKSRYIALVIGILALVGTYLFTFHFGEDWLFPIAIVVFCLLLAFHLSFCRCKLVLTNKRIIGTACGIGDISIPLNAIGYVGEDPISGAWGGRVCVQRGIIDRALNCKFRFVKNPEQVNTMIQNQISKNKADEETPFVYSSSSWGKRISILLIIFAAILSIFIYADLSGSYTTRSWSDLSDIEKQNARWAYEAREAMKNYKK